jgi:hypothetical protein
MPHAVTAGDAFLEQISGQLDEQNKLLGELVGILRPEAPAEPKPPADVKPAKKATTRKVTGQ